MKVVSIWITEGAVMCKRGIFIFWGLFFLIGCGKKESTELMIAVTTTPGIEATVIPSPMFEMAQSPAFEATPSPIESEKEIADATAMTHNGIYVLVSQNEFEEQEKWYPDETSFLEAFEMDDSQLFYEYYDEAGEKQMTLYYNTETQNGLGIGYYQRDPSDMGTSGMYGFTFEGVKEVAWEGWDTDYFATIAWDGSDGKADVEGYEEYTEYDAEGRMTHFESQGIITWLGDEESLEPSQLLWMDYSYYDNGNLKYRYYSHNSMVFSTTCMVQRSYFDEQGRLLYEYQYITHGNWDEYYIYLDEDDVPEYCLMLDHCGYWYPTFVQYEG